MKAVELNALLKRVNFEDDKEVKVSILTAINKYLDVFTNGEVSKAPFEQLSKEIEETEDAPTEQVVVTDVKIEKVENVEVASEAPKQVEIKQETVAQPEATPQPTNDVEEPNAIQQEEAQPATEENVEVPEVEQVQVSLAIDADETKVEEPQQESLSLAAEEVKLEDTEEYTATFNLVSTSEEKHMKAIVERGGVLFREKRSLFMMLCLEDEVVAIGKTGKLDQFSEPTKNHLKEGGFVSIDVVKFSEIVEKGRTRQTDVSYKNLRLLNDSDTIVQNVKNLLEKGEMPEHAQKEEDNDNQTTANEAKNETPAVSSQVEEAQNQGATDEKPFLVTSFMLHPNFVELFNTQKEELLKQTYGITVADNVARFFTNQANGPLVIGMQENSTLKPNNYVATIIDYKMQTVEGRTFIQFQLDAQVVGETVQVNEPTREAAPVESPKEETAKEEAVEALATAIQETAKKVEEVGADPVQEDLNVQMVPLLDVPADFPLTNVLNLHLEPKAEAMFSLEAAKSMVGQALNLGFYQDEQTQAGKVSLMYDVFKMATGDNVLTKEAMRNTKWLANLADVDLVLDAESQRKTLVVKFDQLWEVESFPYEKENLPVEKFVAITDESYNARQVELAQALEAATQATQETVTPEQVLNKEFTPEQTDQLLQPNSTTDYNQGYNQLVDAASKDMGGAMEEIRNQTTLSPQARGDVMDQAQNSISGVITQTLNETGIRAKQEEKQTTEMVGNLQAGVGVLSQTETSIQFLTGYSPDSWNKSVGKRIEIKSELLLNNNAPVTSKLVSVLGKDNTIVAQGQVPLTEALFLDGNAHEVTIKAVEGFIQQQQGFVVTMRVGDFVKKG